MGSGGLRRGRGWGWGGGGQKIVRKQKQKQKKQINPTPNLPVTVPRFLFIYFIYLTHTHTPTHIYTPHFHLDARTTSLPPTNLPTNLPTYRIIYVPLQQLPVSMIIHTAAGDSPSAFGAAYNYLPWIGGKGGSELGGGGRRRKEEERVGGCGFVLISVCTRAPVHAICIIMYVYVGMYVCMYGGWERMYGLATRDYFFCCCWRLGRGIVRCE